VPIEKRSSTNPRAGTCIPETPSAPFPTVPAVMEQLQSQLGDIATGGFPAPAHQDLATLADGDRVDGCYAVRDRSRRPTKRGGEWLALKLADRTATRLLETSPLPLERMEADLADLLETIQNGDLRLLLDRLVAPGGELWERFRDAPAAKHYHQAYRHGLLEHTLSVAQGVSAAASFFPGIDRDVAITGALLHDIGKLEAYNDNPLAIDMTDLGRLIGEIPLGYYRVRREIESIQGFDPDLGWAVLHIILSHHGTLEHGSPVTPATREATLVHMMDNLGGKLGSFDRIERTLAEGQAWSGFDRGIDGSAYFRDRRAA
jgi:3'-5' exoribonuclease